MPDDRIPPTATLFEPGRPVTLAAAPEGADAAALVRIASGLAGAEGSDGRCLLHVAQDDARMARLQDLLGFFGPDLDVQAFPAWDCLPYDRVSPNGEIAAARAGVLTRLADAEAPPQILLTTVSAFLQRIPEKTAFTDRRLTLRVGGRLDDAAFNRFLASNGYVRTGTVREAGEYAVRGGIVDLFPPDADLPVRLDLFGDEIEQMRLFDPSSQRSGEAARRVDLSPVREITLTEESIARFRAGYREIAPAAQLTEDPLYEAVSAGQVFTGMEHWQPLFFEKMTTLADWLPEAVISLDAQASQAIAARTDQVLDHFSARAEFADTRRKDKGLDAGPKYWPLPPDRLYLSDKEVDGLLAARSTLQLSPFPAPEGQGDVIDAGGRAAEGFAVARQDPNQSLMEAVVSVLADAGAAGQVPLVAATSAGAADRLSRLLAEQTVVTAPVGTAGEIDALADDTVGLAVLPLDHGFVTDALFVITEQDIFGEKLVRRARKRARQADEFLTELSAISEGDYVVHMDHGVGQYDGLETLDVSGAPHDCLRLLYAGGDRLFVPVENMDVLSRYGSEDSGAQLDKLGGAGWQARKAAVRKRIREIADKLLAIAAQRELGQGTIIQPEAGVYEEFAAKFPFDETEDQDRAITQVMDDMASGRPMDRLVCGDVGFGKTEVAIRAAFNAVMAGQQVAVVAPTTLLARQHYETFRQRFAGLPVRIGRLSRLVSAKEAAATRKELEGGELDIVIGTHAILGKQVRFQRLGLLVVDEEQHFGVSQKERLKELRADVHVLTLTATPIPRTLQMALAGVREMSLIATPPVDRLAVRTFVLPFDPVVIREGLQRELLRGGQVFYVCPRIRDLAAVEETVRELVPEAKIAIAHGQMAAADLEAVMSRFYDGEFQILIATNIIESGLDIPTVNTIVIHRADMFGLSQLYQLRGRVGRSKVRAYAYLTIPPDRKLTKTAERRLEVMQTLDTLGAGFSLASHDMDIRGAGNLLGEEQSGHIREVGIELYQHMLEEAVAAARDTANVAAGEGEAPDWTPQINIGTPVLIPESYVTDLPVRLGLYRRIASLVDRTEIDAFAAELADRFGPLPDEVNNLLEIIGIKQLCRATNAEKIDAGPKGAILSFRNDDFANPAGLVAWAGRNAGLVKLRPDQKLVYRREWKTAEDRVKGIRGLMRKLSEIVAG